MKSFVGRETELFDFMRAQGYGVYHLSNVFLRDIQYAVRDYHRVHEKKDIGTRASDRIASELVEDLEKRGILRPQAEKTWVLFDEHYRLPSQQEQEMENEKKNEQENSSTTTGKDEVAA